MLARIGRSTRSLHALAALWIVYGIAHFVFSSETLRQVPPYFPLKEALVPATGVLEIVLGACLLPRRTRHLAALGLLLLLAAYIPAIIYMFGNDVLPVSWPAWLRVTTRAWIFPHHVLLTLWVWAHFIADGSRARRFAPRR
jgi:uncharacterized membrane protein